MPLSMPTYCTSQVLWDLGCFQQSLRFSWRFSLQCHSLWTVKHRDIHDIRHSWCVLLLWCVETSQVKTIQLSVFLQSLAQQCYLFLVHWFVCFTCAHSSQHNQHNITMVEWTQTGAVHCHIRRAFLQCFNNQIYASLFHLAFCFHQHITSTSLHSHWLLWITHLIRQTMDCSSLHSVLLQSFVFHHPHHNTQGTRLLLLNNNEFQTWKWKTIWKDAKTKTRLSFHHSLYDSDISMSRVAELPKPLHLVLLCCYVCVCGSLRVRKRGKVNPSKWVVALFFGFPHFSSLSLNHSPPNHLSFHPLNNNPHTPHEHAGNAANGNTLVLFLFTTLTSTPSNSQPPSLHLFQPSLNTP